MTFALWREVQPGDDGATVLRYAGCALDCDPSYIKSDVTITLHLDLIIPWPTLFSPIFCPRFPSAAEPCLGGRDPPTPGRTPPSWSSCARRYYRAAAKRPA